MAKISAPKLALPKMTVPKTSSWLPAVALLLCLSMFGMAAVSLFTVGADPESGPKSLPTSVAAQGYQGLRRLLQAQGHEVVTNRFEDGSKGGAAARGDVEVITLDGDGGVFNPNDTVSTYRPNSRQAASESASASAEASAATSVSASSSQASASASEEATDPTGSWIAPDKRRSDHLLYSPLGRTVIVVLPKWHSGSAPGNPRWAANAGLFDDMALRQLLTVLSPVTEKDSPNIDRDEDDKTPPVVTPAPAGKGVFDDGETLYTYDKVAYDIRQSHTRGNLVLHGAPGQSLFGGSLTVGAIDDLQSVTGPNLTPLLVTADGVPLVSRLTVTDGRRQPAVPVYVVSDPDLLNNQILSDPKRVVSALQIVDTLSPAVRHPASLVFNLTFNNLAFDHDLMHALSRPPWLAVPLSLLLLGLGLMWAAFARFGPPVLAEEGAALGRGVQVLADNAARLMAITLKEAKLGPAYAQMVRDEVIRARGYRQVNPNESLDELADRIGQIYGATDSYTALKARAATLITVHQLIDLTRSLHTWKTEIDRASI